MGYRTNQGHVGVVAIVLLLGVFLSGCGKDGEQTPSADSEATQTPEPEPEETTEEEKPSACLTTKKGPVIKIVTGKSDTGTQFDDVRFFPSKLKLPAGEFVTFKLTNPSNLAHTFTVDSLDCTTDYIQAGQTGFVSFEVPKGSTPFYCTPHEAFMTGEIIGVAK